MITSSIRFWFVAILFIIPISACETPPASAAGLIIKPEDCSLPISSQIGLSLNGKIDPNSQIAWETNFGSIAQTSGLTANYIAPSVAGEAIITVTITSGINAVVSLLSLTCQVIDANATASSHANSGAVPPPLISGSNPETQDYPVIISEVMGNTCGDVDQRKYSQYVELYNYGDQPVDVVGWWIYDEGSPGTPDELTSWSARSNYSFDDRLILNSTVVPAKGIAVILSPIYSQNPSKLPYIFPPGTTILTPANSPTLGDDYFGIITDQNGYDTVTLYIGGSSVIDSIVDTFGTPSIPTKYPVDIEDDHKDNIPTYLSECTSIERVDPRLPDSESNWRPVQNGSPGEVPFN